jgi:hypothetical protein
MNSTHGRWEACSRGSLLAERETGWSRLVPEAVREEACLGPRWPGVGRLEGLSAILSKWFLLLLLL